MFDWRENAISRLVYIYQWDYSIQHKSASAQKKMIKEYRERVSALDDISLFEELISAVRQEGYDDGVYNESYANSMEW